MELGFPVPRTALAGAVPFSLGGRELSCQRGVGGTDPPRLPSLSQRGSEPSGWVLRASHLPPGKEGELAGAAPGPSWVTQGSHWHLGREGPPLCLSLLPPTLPRTGVESSCFSW